MLILIYLGVLGLFIGSFLNVLIDRLPREESIRGRSHCESCGHTLAWFDLIPVVSFLAVGGKCRYCRKKFSWFYPFIEIFTGTVFLLIGLYVFQLNSVEMIVLPPIQYAVLLQILALVVMQSVIIVIVFIDIKYHIIHDLMQVALFISSLGVHLLHGVTMIQMVQYLFAGLVVMLPILILNRIAQGKNMGFGDVELAFNIGFLLGISGGFIALYIAFVTGALVGMVMILLGRKKLKSRIAFGPFLLLGMVTVFFFQHQVTELVLRIFGFNVLF